MSTGKILLITILAGLLSVGAGILGPKYLKSTKLPL